MSEPSRSATLRSVIEFEALSMPNNPTRIKICGLTCVADAQAARDSGADAVGLVFYPGSRRCVTPEVAVAIAAAVGPFVSVVGLFVNPTPAEVEAVLSAVPLNLLQFHGDESAAFCEQFQRPYLKAVRVAVPAEPSPQALSELRQTVETRCLAYPSAAGILLDAYSETAYGGTGETFNWQAVPTDKTELPPLVLAGGLTPGNVAAAITQTQPYAVDVSSGVESAPGHKDPQAIAAFVAAVKQS